CTGKVGLSLGVANQRSLAWAISEKLSKAGAKLAFTYQGERLQENVTSLASRCDGSLVMACDVTSDEQMDGVFNRLRREFGRLDFLVHSIAFARREDLDGEFRATSRDGWHTSAGISLFSLFVLMARAGTHVSAPAG